MCIADTSVLTYIAMTTFLCESLHSSQLACGFMWGLGPGIAVAVPAKLAGSTLSFIAARYFLGDSVEKQVWSKYKYSDAMRQLVRPW